MYSEREQKLRVVSIFDQIASKYDHPALRFFPFCADYMVHRLRPRPGAKLLDVATGTGVVATSAAQIVGPQGRVTAIDLSEGMLDRAFQNTKKMAVANVDFHTMDAEHLEFRGKYFDYVVCSFGIMFLTDMQGAVREWLRVVKPGGTVMFSSFGASAFQPLGQLFRSRVAGFGLQGQEHYHPVWARLTAADQCRVFLEAAGTVDVAVHERQFGYHIQAAEDWWAILCNSGLAAFLHQLEPQQLQRLRDEHLAEIADLETDQGIWLNVPVLICEGRRAI